MSEPTPCHNPVKGKIPLTLAGLLLITALGSLPFVAGPPPEDGLPDLAKFIGRFHPVVLHLPIGILVWVLLQEFPNLLPGKRVRPSSRTAAGLAAGTSAAAAVLGFLLYYSMPDYDQELAGRHLYGGILFSCMMEASFVVKVWVDSAGGRGNAFYRILLLATAVIMGAASHDGASLTHGKGYLTDHAPAPLRKLLGLPAKESAASTKSSRTGDDRIVYEDVIVPVLERKCYSCHNAEKQKGHYRMDQYELLLKGGEDGHAIIPGNTAESNLLTRIHLPESDDEHMPPEGKKALDDHEIQLLEWWIGIGAPADKRLADLAVTDEARAALARQAEQSAEEAPKEVVLSESLKADIERLRQEFPAALNYEYQGSGTLVFSALGMRGTFTDGDLAKLQPVLSHVVELDLSNSAITDTGVNLLAEANGLRSLRLAETKITDAALETLAGLPELESLNLHGTQVSGQGVMKLSTLRNLRKLYLWRTSVDEETLKTLREKLPECEIITGT